MKSEKSGEWLFHDVTVLKQMDRTETVSWRKPITPYIIVAMQYTMCSE